VNETLRKTMEIIFSSERSMPAHFSSNGERTQSFCVDFEPLSAEDDYEMASDVWHAYTELPRDPAMTDLESYLILRCGEDIMLGAYVITKLGGEKLIDEMKGYVIDDTIESFSDKVDRAQEVLSTEAARGYFEYCSKTGFELASRC